MSALAYRIRGKLTGVFKQLLGRPAGTQRTESADSSAHPQTTSATGTASAHARNPLGAATQNSPYALALPLNTILRQLPPELQNRVAVRTADVPISVPMQTILPQLAHGSVKISFGELRALAPGVFTPTNDRDHVLVQLPLAEILPRINPAFLRRRPNQKRVHVPDDIIGPFADRGKGVVISCPTIPQRPSALPHTAGQSASSQVHTKAIPAVEPKPVQAPKPVQTTQPIPFARAHQPPAIGLTKAPLPAQSVQDAVPMPGITDQKQSPALEQARQNAPVITHPPQPQIKIGPVAQTASQENLSLPLAQLCEGWPELVKQEIAVLNLSRATVALPAEFVEAGLKQARVTCTWRQLRGWLQPPVPPDAPSMCDDIVLDLPLRVVAPAFLARNRRPRYQTKPEFAQEIPDIFVGPSKPGRVELGTPQPEPGIAQATEFTVPAVETLQARQAQKLPETDYFVWPPEKEAQIEPEPLLKKGQESPGTDFLKRFAPPNEIVARAVALDGVAGALIALPDGLLVAGRVPPEFNPDTLAAFLPQMFARVSQCTKELRMGELNNLNFTVGNVPWRIFKIGAIFFAAFGRAGVPLPTAQLTALAAELDRKPRQTTQ